MWVDGTVEDSSHRRRTRTIIVDGGPWTLGGVCHQRGRGCFPSLRPKQTSQRRCSDFPAYLRCRSANHASVEYQASALTHSARIPATVLLYYGSPALTDWVRTPKIRPLSPCAFFESLWTLLDWMMHHPRRLSAGALLCWSCIRNHFHQRRPSKLSAIAPFSTGAHYLPVTGHRIGG